MNSKNILSWGAFALGLILVVCGWFMWGDRSDNAIFALNVAISLLMYVIVSSGFLISWSQPEDKSESRIGNMGLVWSVVFIYVLVALVILVLSNLFDWSLGLRLFAHGVAIVSLIGGFAAVSHSSSNIKNVHEQQSQERLGVDKMRRVAKDLQCDMQDKGTIPAEITAKVAALIEDMRFVAPSNSEEASELEERFVKIIKSAHVMLTSPILDNQQLAAEIAKAERVLKERRQQYSN